MWTYRQSTGELLHNDVLIGVGYSGHGEGRNNPALQAVADVGPIPRGRYYIGNPEYVKAPGPHGPYTLRLSPEPGTDTHGRDGFLIHGDSLEHPGAASHGCIIQALIVRTHVAASGDHALDVVA